MLWVRSRLPEPAGLGTRRVAPALGQRVGALAKRKQVASRLCRVGCRVGDLRLDLRLDLRPDLRPDLRLGSARAADKWIGKCEQSVSPPLPLYIYIVDV